MEKFSRIISSRSLSVAVFPKAWLLWTKPRMVQSWGGKTPKQAAGTTSHNTQFNKYFSSADPDKMEGWH